jgi:hypothetical protein
VYARRDDEWTVERWRLKPRWNVLDEVDEPQFAEQVPPLWKDLTVAAIAAMLLWGAAAALFG